MPDEGNVTDISAFVILHLRLLGEMRASNPAATRQVGTPLGLRGALPRWHALDVPTNPEAADEAKKAGHHAGLRMVMQEPTNKLKMLAQGVWGPQ